MGVSFNIKWVASAIGPHLIMQICIWDDYKGIATFVAEGFQYMPFVAFFFGGGGNICEFYTGYDFHI